jgi:hypothetical protein
MTLQSNYLIEFRDILGMEFECQNAGCRAKLTIEISKDSKVVGKCPFCFARWMAEDTQEYANVTHLLALLRNMDDHLKG